MSQASKTYWSYWDQLEIRDGVLHQRWESDDGGSIRWRIVVPEQFRQEFIDELHGRNLSGLKKTLACVRQRYFWSGMVADVRACLRRCSKCARRKPPPNKRIAPLQQYNVRETMGRVAMDLVGPLPRTEGGNQWFLVVGDYSTRWMEAYALPDARAETVATKSVNEFVCRFGVPREVHSDQGANFESEVFQEMCRILGISKTRTTAYNPTSDGLIERFNQTLINMVSVMIQLHKGQRDWDKYLTFATSAYRCRLQESMGNPKHDHAWARGDTPIGFDCRANCSDRGGN